MCDQADSARVLQDIHGEMELKDDKFIFGVKILELSHTRGLQRFMESAYHEKNKAWISRCLKYPPATGH